MKQSGGRLRERHTGEFLAFHKWFPLWSEWMNCPGCPARRLQAGLGADRCRRAYRVDRYAAPGRLDAVEAVRRRRRTRRAASDARARGQVPAGPDEGLEKAPPAHI